ncbi:hypothetical protein [Actinacidiphila bryophytorum]|uniref:hypothetical protein n=1 Tax=Actinacidiphila bryophytorum TaxID=1436133 RepID=UPI002176DB2E|nr:hypothetical protein [Actinacidiphila bryophytorum]UWE13577.1 hypothetical protein NYE86_02320 [Actinacidiphila bryophytorum]
MANTGGTSESIVILAEYAQIKDEQRSRIGFRDNLLYVTLAAVTAVTTVAAQTEHPDLALALPLICVVLGWTYLVNDEKISSIGRYVRTQLEPKLAAVTGSGTTLFEWETFHRGDSRRWARKTIQTVVDLIAFLVVPFAALIAFWCYGRTSETLLLVASGLEAAAVAGLGLQFLIYAER